MPGQNPLPIIDCQGCGVCCFHMGYPAFQSQLEGSQDAKYWQDMPDHLRQELENYIRKYKPVGEGEWDGPCFWLDLETRECKHHEHRPTVCRNFQTGSTSCQEWRVYYQDRILPRS